MEESIKQEKNEKSQLSKIFNRLTLKQKITIVVASLLSLIFIIAVVMISTKTEYKLLYPNLSPADISAISSKLSEQGIPYELRGPNSNIYVPTNQINYIKISMANEGLPKDPVNGYEIFDNSKLGMTDFMQKLNKKRALEGELSRTIMSITGINSCRIHIAIPQKAIFKEDETPPKASVLLNINRNFNYTKNHIDGILNLVANSINGLEKTNISVIDQNGKQLNQIHDPNSISGITSAQYRIKNEVEQMLTVQAQSLLDQILGYGKSVVRINASLNFEKVDKIIEQYDPESQVLRSEENTEQTSSNNNGNKENHGSNVLNYEIDKTIANITKEIGNIKKISIAVSVDGKYDEITDEDGKTRIVYKKRSQQELDQITTIIKSSVGFDTKRGDNIDVVNLQFINENNQLIGEQSGLNLETIDFIKTSIKYIGIIILVLLILFVFKSLLNKSRLFSKDIWDKLLNGKISGKIVTPEGEVVDTSELLTREEKILKKQNQDIEEDLENEQTDRVKKNEKIREFVDKNEEKAASLIKSWIYDNGKLLDS